MTSESYYILLIILSVRIRTTKSLINYLPFKTDNCWCSVDAHCQNRAESVALSHLPTKAAYTSFMNGCNQFSLRSTLMQDQTLLTLVGCLVLEWCREPVAFSFAYNCGLYLMYECLHPIATQFTQDARPTIIDGLLTLIFRMGQGTCLCCFWL